MMASDGQTDRIVIRRQDCDLWVATAVCDGAAPQPLICFPSYDDALLWLDRDASAWAHRMSSLRSEGGRNGLE